MPANHPNILVILTDDHGRWASGCYGNREVRTLTLDYLAQTGTRFAHAFTPTPVCSPARASFWTGRLPSQHGIHDYLAEFLPEVAARDWLTGEVTLAQMLHDAGYTTALAGKWHCGGEAAPQPGWDHWFSPGDIRAPHDAPHTYFLDGTPVPLTGYRASLTTDHALRFLRERDPDRPLFLFAGYVATHSPWRDHPERLVAPYRHATFADIPRDAIYPFGRRAGEGMGVRTVAEQREAQAQYYAAVSEIDEQVGRLLDALVSAGMWDNTVVVYTADHGLNTGQHGLWGKGNSTRPYNMLEESIRVPLLVRTPGEQYTGAVRDEFADHCDLLPTLLDLAGVPLPAALAATRRYPGRSLAPLLRGQALPHRDAVFGEYGNLRMVRTRTHKLVRRYPDGPHELFDLAADPRETTNCFTDGEAQPLVRELTARIEVHFAAHEEPEYSGLRVRELPRHNNVEDWREGEQ